MKRGVKFYKKLISLFLAVMMIYTMAFTGVKVYAITNLTLTLRENKANKTITATASSNALSIIDPDGKVTKGTTTYQVVGNGTYVFTTVDSYGNTKQTSKEITDLSGYSDNNNGNWRDQTSVVQSTNEASLMVRVGDIDNFGNSWTGYVIDHYDTNGKPQYKVTGYDGNKNPIYMETTINPFSGRETKNHGYPFSPSSDDVTYADGTDRIMVVSGYNYSGNYKSTGKDRDGYTETTSRNTNKVRSINIPYTLGNISVQNATIQMFVDDFQPGSAHGISQGNVKYTATINGVEIPELSNVINNLDESGPIGKMITFQIPQDKLDLVRNYSSLSIKIDDNDNNCTGDGYAIDFAKLLINRTGFQYTAKISGYVTDCQSSAAMRGVTVSAGGIATTTNTEGYYSLDVPAGQAVVTADGKENGYNSQTYTEKTVVGGYTYSHNFQLTDIAPPTLTLTQNTTTATNGTVTITATASDNVAVASITTPDGKTAQFNPATQSNSTTYTVSANGPYTFTATDTAGNVGTQSINISNINGVSSMPQVKIDVTDSSGLLDEYNANSDNPLSRVDKDVTDKNYVLKGDAYANFSVNSSNANAFQYSIIKNSGKQTDIPNSGWTDLDLQATDQGNSDVDISKQGYLTQRAYDVNHMATLTDTINWSNPAQVFKYPYPELGYKNADTSATKDAYGHEESVVPYTIIDVNGNPITVSSRWHSNTVFMRNMDIFGAYKEASKFWGYITVPQDGNYVFGAASDDGCRGWITVDGTARQFVNMFQPQSVSFGSTNTVLSLKAGKYYPIYLEYFNWGGSAAFQLYYTNTKSSMHSASDGALIPKDWFYPSKSASPGEYSQTLFTGTKGVKLPSEPGQYYIAYRTGIGTKTDGSTTIDSSKAGYRDGIYGPFVVKPTASLELTKDYDSQNAVAGRYFKINYTITPREIPVSDFSSTNPQNLQVSNIKFNELLPSGLTTDNANINPSSNLQVVLNGNAISGNISQTIQYRLDSTGTKYIADPISFSIWVKSDTASSYSMSGQSSYINYKDIDDGNKKANFNNLDITVSNPTKSKPAIPVITSDPTTTTTGKVTVTISYSSDSVTKQYRINDGTTTGDWQTYSGPFEVSKNCTIEAKGIDSAGTESDIASYDINNIVAAPNVPVINVSPTAFTNDKDIVTITYSDDSTIKQYRIKTGTTTGDWQTYTDPFDVTENCTIEAKGTNQYHIESQTASHDINNIDKIAPSGPTISLNNNNQVMITPGVDNDGGSGVKEVKYKIYSGSTSDNNQTWTTYQNSFDPNMQIFTVQAKTIDNAGNESSVVTQTFDMASTIIKHGIYDVKSNQNDYINTNNKVSNGIPINIAMVINAKAFNPTIDLNIGDISKISDQNINSGIDVKEYEISNGTIGALINEKYLGINNSSISINSSDGFVMNEGHEYIMIYTITPKGSANDTIDMTATVRNTSNSNRLELQTQDMPDLF